MDITHLYAAIAGAVGMAIAKGLGKTIDALFDWLCLLIERQKARAKRKVDEIQSGE